MSDFERAGLEKLSDGNFKQWEIEMQLFLQSKRLWGAIAPQSAPGAGEAAVAANAAAVAAAAATSEQVKAILGLSVEPKFRRLVMAAADARAAWAALQQQFAAESHTRKLTLKKELCHLKMHKGERVDDFFARAQELSDALGAAGQPVTEEDLAQQIINGLSEDFDTKVSILLERAEPLRVTAMQSSLREHEARLAARQKSSQGEEASTGYRGTQKAFAAKGRQRSQTPPPRKQGSHRDGRPSSDRRCYYCKEAGHLIAECRQRKEDERQGRSKGPSFRPARQQETQHNTALSVSEEGQEYLEEEVPL